MIGLLLTDFISVTTMECSLAYVVHVEASIPISNATHLQDALQNYLSSTHGNPIMCAYILNASKQRALCWLASSNAALHLMSQPLIHLGGSLSARFTWPSECKTNIFRVTRTEGASSISIQDVFALISPDYTAYDRNQELLVQFRTEVTPKKMQGYDFDPVSATDIYLLHGSWHGKSLTDIQRNMLIYNKDFVSIVQNALYLSGIDVCILAIRCTGFATLCIACATQLDADLIREKVKQNAMILGEFGKLSIQQMYRSTMGPFPQSSSPASITSKVTEYEHFIIWDIEECTLAPDDDIRDIDKRLLFSGSSYKDALMGSSNAYRVMFSIHSPCPLSPRQLQDLADLRYKLLFNASLSTIFRELEDLPRRCSGNRNTKPVVLLLSGMPPKALSVD